MGDEGTGCRDLRDETVCDAVAEGDKGQGHERGDGVTYVIPVDGDDLADHQAANLVMNC